MNFVAQKSNRHQNFIVEKLMNYEQKNLIRKNLVVEERENCYVKINNNKLINFSSSDYLGLSTHPKVIAAFKAAADQYGFGSGSSQMICGHYQPHHQLEKEFAAFLNRESAILFNSGYHANLGVISVLADKDSAIFSDKSCHASILDAIKLAQAKHYRYAHNDVNHLQARIRSCPFPKKIIITESVFSMDGDVPDISNIVNVAKNSDALIMIDEAHGMGVLGHDGGGSCSEFNLDEEDVALVIVPLGKALGGLGAIVAGKKHWIEAIKQFARTYMFTTALPPAIAAGNLIALRMLSDENWRRVELHKKIQFFQMQARLRNLPFKSNFTPIQCFIVADNEIALNLKNLLIERGFLVGAIRPPSVPANTARLRISLTCMHTEEHIVELLDALRLGCGVRAATSI